LRESVHPKIKTVYPKPLQNVFAGVTFISEHSYGSAYAAWYKESRNVKL